MCVWMPSSCCPGEMEFCCMCIYTSNSSLQPLGYQADLRGTEYCACFNLRKAARAVTHLFDAGLRPTGIRSTQFALLVAIAKLAPVSIGRLAQILVIDHTTLTRSLRLMERQGFVAISPRSTRRQRFVTLLPKGWDALARSLPFWRETQRHFVDQVGGQYWRSLQEELEKLSIISLDAEKAVKGASPTL